MRYVALLFLLCFTACATEATAPPDTGPAITWAKEPANDEVAAAATKAQVGTVLSLRPRRNGCESCILCTFTHWPPPEGSYNCSYEPRCCPITDVPPFCTPQYPCPPPTYP